MGCRGFRQYRDRLQTGMCTVLRDESGQSIILVSIVILSFLMFFSFAINTGLLINAKISVQSAADAAAYAGAAVQARQLNAISFLNYDMRRQYKKFIFRNSFVGSMGSYKFPATLSNNPNADYDFEKLDYTLPAPHINALQVPVVCIPLTTGGQANDNCSFVNMKSTAHSIKLLTAGANPIQQALMDSLAQIENVQVKLCTGQGQMNLLVFLSWLFRADVNPSSITQLLQQLANAGPIAQTQAETDRLIQTISPLVGGLGLYPRNIINLMRIDTLKGFINEPHASDVDAEQVESWEKDKSVAESKERSIQAFKSALANLNTAVFDPANVKLDELQKDQGLDLQDILINFNGYLQQTNGGSNNSSGATICNSSVDAFPVISAPVGVRIGGNPQVNYAVHLKAFIRPHGLMYLPNSEPLELDAYAGAKPFGSRIGPAAISESDFTKNIQPTAVNGAPTNTCDGTAKCLVPYLQVGAGANTYSTKYLVDLVGKAKTNNAYSGPGILNAMMHAMAPSPEEVGHYNILPPAKDDMRFDYIPYADAGKSTATYKFYAPIFANGKGDVAAKVSKFLDLVFDKTQVTANVFGINQNDMRIMLSGQVTGYINSTLNDPKQSELGETQTFASIELPMPVTLQKGTGFWLTEANQVLSSWAPSYGRTTGAADGFGFSPRFGYSVKFVTLHDLQSQGISSDDEDIQNVSH